MKIEEVFKILDGMDKVLSRLLDLVHHEQEKLKKFKEDYTENPLEWSNRKL